MAEATLSLILRAKNLAGGEIKGLNAQIKGLTKDGLGGLGIGFLGAAGAAGILAGGLKDAIGRAAEDQKSMAKLTAALKANVPAWDGNTAAIEAAEQAAEDYGFQGSEITDSLATLIPATKNLNKALDVQKTAMDLARLKGISLQEASEALTKVEAGQYRGLKALGIVLKEGATQTEALAAVTAVAEGQAAAFAETLDGKVARANAKFDDAMGKLGEQSLPVVTEGVDLLATAMDLIPYIDVNRQTQLLAAEWVKAGDKATDLRSQINRLDDANLDMAANVPGVVDHLHDLKKGLSLTGAEALELVNGMIDLRREERYLSGLGHERRTGNPQTPRSKTHNGPQGASDKATEHAAGGWTGLGGPELAWLGEREPEYVIPRSRMGQMGGQTIVLQLDGREVARVVDGHNYYRAQRKAS